jgi:L-arabinose transport system ATP-binding protein
MGVGENLWLIAMRQLHRYSFVQDRSLRKLAADYVQKLKVRTPHLEQEIQFLSGGNQQKVVIAKWLTTRPRILILDEPTRGIDIGAKAEIYEMIRELAGMGTAIVLVSSELPEVLANSDRIIVMADGHIAGELSRAEATEDAVMALSHADVSEVMHAP